MRCKRAGASMWNLRWQLVAHTLHVQMHGGGQVPLSRAKCCRICVPDTISADTTALMPPDANATAVISVGCHSSTTQASVTCEADPATAFVTGFQHAVLVRALASPTFYPEGPVTCCSPVLMLSTGAFAAPMPTQVAPCVRNVPGPGVATARSVQDSICMRAVDLRPPSTCSWRPRCRSPSVDQRSAVQATRGRSNAATASGPRGQAATRLKVTTSSGATPSSATATTATCPSRPRSAAARASAPASTG